jgi:hypothetical protein
MAAAWSALTSSTLFFQPALLILFASLACIFCTAWLAKAACTQQWL